MGTIAGPGSHLPINRCDRPKRFRSWLSRSEPIPTIRNAASGHAKKICSNGGQVKRFLLSGRISQGRVPAAVMALGKKQGPRYPGTKTCCALPRTQQTVDLRHLGPCDRALSVDLQKLHPCRAMPSHRSLSFRVAPGTLPPARIRSVTSRPFASLERLRDLRPRGTYRPDQRPVNKMGAQLFATPNVSSRPQIFWLYSGECAISAAG